MRDQAERSNECRSTVGHIRLRGSYKIGAGKGQSGGRRVHAQPTGGAGRPGGIRLSARPLTYA
jgi:hypothetical protein